MRKTIIAFLLEQTTHCEGYLNMLGDKALRKLYDEVCAATNETAGV